MDKLTEYQQDLFDTFMYHVELGGICLKSIEGRAIGKTHALNELGFNLQALGYEVFVSTITEHIEYFAEMFVSVDSQSWRGMLDDKCVVLVDEIKVSKMDELIRYCEMRKIPVVGFVNFD